MKNIFLIVNYNDFDNTYKLYKNIEKYECLDEIVIIDNASKKDSPVLASFSFLSPILYIYEITASFS